MISLKSKTASVRKICFLLFLGEKVIIIEKRIWIRSGIVEELDQRQLKFLDFVLDKIKYYYRELYGTRDCYRHPLTLSRLSKLCNRNTTSVISAVRILANSISYGSGAEPPISYDRIKSLRNNTHRVYRIFLKDILWEQVGASYNYRED
jgi:hypothetical protein